MYTGRKVTEKLQENKHYKKIFISATVDGLELASKPIFEALTHMNNLNEQERKMGRSIMVKTQRGHLINPLKQTTHLLTSVALPVFPFTG
jgi:hypothetical protein